MESMKNHLIDKLFNLSNIPVFYVMLVLIWINRIQKDNSDVIYITQYAISFIMRSTDRINFSRQKWLFVNKQWLILIRTYLPHYYQKIQLLKCSDEILMSFIKKLQKDYGIPREQQLSQFQQECRRIFLSLQEFLKFSNNIRQSEIYSIRQYIKNFIKINNTYQQVVFTCVLQYYEKLFVPKVQFRNYFDTNSMIFIPSIIDVDFQLQHKTSNFWTYFKDVILKFLKGNGGLIFYGFNNTKVKVINLENNQEGYYIKPNNKNITDSEVKYFDKKISQICNQVQKGTNIMRYDGIGLRKYIKIYLKNVKNWSKTNNNSSKLIIIQVQQIKDLKDCFWLPQRFRIQPN